MRHFRLAVTIAAPPGGALRRQWSNAYNPARALTTVAASGRIRPAHRGKRRTGRCRRIRGRRRISGVENTGKMRHFPQALTIAALPGGVLRPPGQAVLVPAACREQAGPTRVIGALRTAVRPSEIASSAYDHLRPAPGAQEQTACVRHRRPRIRRTHSLSTVTAGRAILARHRTCTVSCVGPGTARTWQFEVSGLFFSALCSQRRSSTSFRIRRHVHRACMRSPYGLPHTRTTSIRLPALPVTQELNETHFFL